jgi:hypothetical protein
MSLLTATQPQPQPQPQVRKMPVLTAERQHRKKIIKEKSLEFVKGRDMKWGHHFPTNVYVYEDYRKRTITNGIASDYCLHVIEQYLRAKADRVVVADSIAMKILISPDITPRTPIAPEDIVTVALTISACILRFLEEFWPAENYRPRLVDGACLHECFYDVLDICHYEVRISSDLFSLLVPQIGVIIDECLARLDTRTTPTAKAKAPAEPAAPAAAPATAAPAPAEPAPATPASVL